MSLLTYSFPCTDLSIAGRMEGMSKGSGTRSGLLWEIERILEELGDNLPDILIMENVPQVHSKKNIKDFETWCTFLENKGYKNFWQDMNASDYGVAQSRNRCFMVSIMGDFNYDFPDVMKQTSVVDDYLENEVDDKYFINSEKADKLIRQLIESGVIEPQKQHCQFAIDMSSNKPQKIRIANCITTAQRGISKHQKEGTGVVTMSYELPQN